MQLEHFYDQDPEKGFACPINYTLDIVRRKWVIPVLCVLNQNGSMRYSELKTAVSCITNPVLSSVLKSLEKVGLVSRQQFNEMPLRVEYDLTDQGREVLPSLFTLGTWGLELMEQNGVACTCSESCYASRNLFLNSRQSQIMSAYPNAWDEEYERVGAELASEAYAHTSALQKLEHFLTEMLRILTEGDIEFNRLLMVYMFGLGNAQLLDSQRPHYAILERLIAMCQEEGSITKEKTTTELIQLLLRLIAGMECEWVLNGGTYDVIDNNKDNIAWLLSRMGP